MAARASCTRSLSKSTLPPPFLCPALVNASPRLLPNSLRIINAPQRQYAESAPVARNDGLAGPPSILSVLPLQCPGCGAFTQNHTAQEAGYYSTDRKIVKAYLAHRKAQESVGRNSEVGLFAKVLQNADASILRDLGLENSLATSPTPPNEASNPICNRCHDLIHHHAGAPIIHPTLASIQSIISESPYKYNHVYHILDAADFPLSLIPRLHHYLSLTPQRSLNRRSKLSKYTHGRKAEMSFIITRSDLLAPKKEQVDSLMPYLVEVLRDAIGQAAKDVRLGNVRCVSSKRGWWTKEVKEAIWERGGGGWMVGKVNVGKSALFESIFPKGRNQEVNFDKLRTSTNFEGRNDINDSSSISPLATSRQEAESLSKKALLPPAPPEKHFPPMPTVSSLPGTTASPIRLLFGSGKGELIDLPGLARGNLEEHVLDEYKPALVMQQRIKPESLSIKPGQSLVIGGIIRITPNDTGQVMLAYPFVPIQCHVTSTEKAISLQSQKETSHVLNIAKPGIGGIVRSAGVFHLNWDTTKQRTGPLTRPSAVGLKPQNLPFVVYSADLLIEGCGWIELAVQVRRRIVESHKELAEDSHSFPTAEVFSPNGEYVGLRRPMNAWLLGGSKPVAVGRRTTRPRPSMKGVKKTLKRAARVAAKV